MYVFADSSMHGPGTALVQRIDWSASQERTLEGLGCGSCGGSCGRCGLLGLGIFDSGFDWTQWGWGEWLTVGFGAYVVLSIAGDTRRTVSGVRKFRRRRRAA